MAWEEWELWAVCQAPSRCQEVLEQAQELTLLMQLLPPQKLAKEQQVPEPVLVLVPRAQIPWPVCLEAAECLTCLLR